MRGAGLRLCGESGPCCGGIGCGLERLAFGMQAAHPALGGRAGYLWGDKVQFVPTADIGDHIGFAAPELRRLSVEPIVNIDAATLAAFREQEGFTEEASG